MCIIFANCAKKFSIFVQSDLLLNSMFSFCKYLLSSKFLNLGSFMKSYKHRSPHPLMYNKYLFDFFFFFFFLSYRGCLINFIIIDFYPSPCKHCVCFSFWVSPIFNIRGLVNVRSKFYVFVTICAIIKTPNLTDIKVTCERKLHKFIGRQRMEQMEQNWFCKYLKNLKQEAILETEELSLEDVEMLGNVVTLWWCLMSW